MKRIFITGTDTDCGKTYITCELLNYLNRNNYTAQGLKPVASGVADNYLNDIYQLQQANHNPSQIINNWCYKEPIAPHIAANYNNQQISASEVAAFCSQSQFNHYDYLLIEGAGGIMVPLNEKETWMDFLSYFKASVVLVVSIRLGCINHALLSDLALNCPKINYLGWIANFTQPKTPEDNEIVDLLIKKMNKPLITSVSHYGKIEKFNTFI